MTTPCPPGTRAPQRSPAVPRLAASALLLALLAACAPPPPPPAPSAESLRLPASAASRWVAVGRPADAALLVLPAAVEGAPATLGAVVPPASAQVLAVEVQVGDAVTAGQVVAQVRVPALVAAQARADSTTRRLRPVQARLAAVRNLRKDGLAAGDAVFALEAEVATLEAARAEAEAEFVAAGLTAADRAGLRGHGRLALRAPVSGRVRGVDAPIGAVRGPNDAPLMTLVGVGTARVAVRSARPLPLGLTAVRFVGSDGVEVPLEVTPLAAVPSEDGPGQVIFFSSSSVLAAGLRGEVHLSVAGDSVVEVPRGAVWLLGDGAVVARQAGTGAQWVPVQVLTGAGATALVRGPLRVGDLVSADARRLVASGLIEAPTSGAAEPRP